MPFVGLEIKCQLAGITDLRPNDPNGFRFHLKLKCTNCGEQPDTWQYVVQNELQEIPGSRGEANIVEKCKLCGRSNTLTILPETFKTYKLENNEKWQFLVVFDCRGIEPVDFDPRNDWLATGSESGTAFEDIDLTEKSWADYDEKAGESVEIQDFECRFTHVKDLKKLK
ncbi:unnamed protein product [Caenorhabditis angaria]|uniref:CXXC motif containing zinc binding protein n=1 Tax=Caenorhabditis angaria TaxID=860376 RepID=A0A9P1N921_9PELO|nr:unnamed protein product [Caenorhabditis angaria]